MSSAILERMDQLVAGWGAADRRSLFAGAYRTMSANTLTAIDSGDFVDSAWVGDLLASFANYYFEAVDAFDDSSGECPEIWTMAFNSSGDGRVHPLRVLFLGINAHINYDLALSVADVMSDWDELDPEQRGLRRRDYDTVDEVIRRTVDAVQDGVVAPVSPGMRLLDRVMGPFDEWLFAALISRWRRDTWADAVRILTSVDGDIDEARGAIESDALRTAEWIIEVGPD